MDILKAMGAEVYVCPTNVEPEHPESYYSVAKRLNEEIPNSFYPNQYDNLSNRLAHYESTGPEIWEQTDGKITHFIVGVGTGGTISGILKFLKEKNPNVKIWELILTAPSIKNITKQVNLMKMRFILTSPKVLARIYYLLMLILILSTF